MLCLLKTCRIQKLRGKVLLLQGKCYVIINDLAISLVLTTFRSKTFDFAHKVYMGWAQDLLTAGLHTGINKS